MTFRYYKTLHNTIAIGSLLRFKTRLLPVLIFVLAFSMNTAWSYESYQTPNNKNYGLTKTYSKKVPSSAVADMCKSLLKSNHHISPNSATVRNQRTAGKVTALGMLLGARFALDPKNNNTHKSQPIRQHVRIKDGKILGNDRSAQAIAAYRRCQKEYVLSQVASMK